MTHDAELDPVYAANLAELRGDVAHGLKTDGTFATVRIPALDNVLRVVDDLLQALADTRQQLEYAREANQIMREATATAREARPCGRSATHPPHKWMSDRRAIQCAGVGLYVDPTAEGDPA